LRRVPSALRLVNSIISLSCISARVLGSLFYFFDRGVIGRFGVHSLNFGMGMQLGPAECGIGFLKGGSD